MRSLEENQKFFDWLKSHDLDIEECAYVLKWTENGVSLAEALSDIMNFRTINKECKKYEDVDWGKSHNSIT